MTRNTTKRVEVAAPVYDAELKERVLSMFQLILRDNVKARILQSDGNYVRCQPAEIRLNAQEYFIEASFQN